MICMTPLTFSSVKVEKIAACHVQTEAAAPLARSSCVGKLDRVESKIQYSKCKALSELKELGFTNDGPFRNELLFCCC